MLEGIRILLPENTCKTSHEDITNEKVDLCVRDRNRKTITFRINYMILEVENVKENFSLYFKKYYASKTL